MTPEQRKSAETVFMAFRKTRSPYQLCRQLLETSTVDHVLFETAGLLKTALIDEWKVLSPEDVASLKQYLLHYVINKPTLAPFVRERLLQVIAIIIKKGGIEDFGVQRKQLLDEVEGLILSSNMSRVSEYSKLFIVKKKKKRTFEI